MSSSCSSSSTIHRVVDGDDADQPVVVVHHGGRDQVVLVEGIGDVALAPPSTWKVRNVSSAMSRSFTSAPRRQQPAQRDVAHRLHPRIDQDDVVELVRQVRPLARRKSIASPTRPVLGRAHRPRAASGGRRSIPGRSAPARTATRSARSSASRIASCCGSSRSSSRSTTSSRFQLAHRLGQHLGRQQRGDHLLADALVQLRQDLAVDARPSERQQPRALALARSAPAGRRCRRRAAAPAARFSRARVAALDRVEHVVEQALRSSGSRPRPRRLLGLRADRLFGHGAALRRGLARPYGWPRHGQQWPSRDLPAARPIARRDQRGGRNGTASSRPDPGLRRRSLRRRLAEAAPGTSARGAVLVEDGRIAAVGPADALARRASAGAR